jgi:hypothetical protein
MTLTVISEIDYAEQQIETVSAVVADLPTASLDSPGHLTSLSSSLENALENALKDLEKGKIASAIDKLTSVIERTDGCVVRGSVDGPGPGKDWVLDCDAQHELHALLQAAIGALQP